MWSALRVHGADQSARRAAAGSTLAAAAARAAVAARAASVPARGTGAAARRTRASTGRAGHPRRPRRVGRPRRATASALTALARATHVAVELVRSGRGAHSTTALRAAAASGAFTRRRVVADSPRLTRRARPSRLAGLRRLAGLAGLARLARLAGLPRPGLTLLPDRAAGHGAAAQPALRPIRGAARSTAGLPVALLRRPRAARGPAHSTLVRRARAVFVVHVDVLHCG